MQLTNEQHNILINWLTTNIVPRKSINHNFDTSVIRQTFTYETNLYVDNDIINDAMLELGYHAANFANDPYLIFNISAQSPALQIYQNKILGRH